jgi:hypothetical protein
MYAKYTLPDPRLYASVKLLDEMIESAPGRARRLRLRGGQRNHGSGVPSIGSSPGSARLGISLYAAATTFATVARTSVWRRRRRWAQDEREAREETRRERLREVDIGGKVCALLT